MTDVSRETPPPPTSAKGVFHDRFDLISRYADLLVSEGTIRGLIGPREVPRLWDRHILNCALLTDLIDRHASVADIGSGAGLPGVVLAVRRPDLRVVLIESMLRRAAFLSEVVDALELHNVEVMRARAEELFGTHKFDVVTSRAVADLTKLSRWSMPLVRPGGVFLPMKGANVASEIAGASSILQSLGATSIEALSLGGDGVYPHVTAVAVRKSLHSD